MLVLPIGGQGGVAGGGGRADGIPEVRLACFDSLPDDHVRSLRSFNFVYNTTKLHDELQPC